MPQVAASSACQYRLRRQQKLLNGAQFKVVFSRRCPVHGKFFSFHVAENSQQGPRIGLAVSRKISKKAVQRNRIKRQIRESFRLNQERLSAIDFVVVAKPGSADQENRILRVELDKLWQIADQKCENCRQK